MQLTDHPIIPNDGPAAGRPSMRQAVLPLRVSARAVLSGIEFAHNVFGQDNESIIDRYMDGSREDHIRFVFNMSAGRQVQEPRFWNTEILAPDSVKKFTITEAIAAILGARESFSRAEIGIQWSLSSNLLTDLIRSGQLKSPNGGRLQRPDLEAFLLSRWTGTPTVKIINLGHPNKP